MKFYFLLFVSVLLTGKMLSAQVKIDFGSNNSKMKPIVIETEKDEVVTKDLPFADPKVTKSIELGNKDKVHYSVDKLAEFPGGNDEMMRFVSKNVNYPYQARELGIQGVVKVKLLVDEKGVLSNFEVVKSIKGGCDREAVRVCKKMPTWIPATLKGKPVKSTFILPFMFSIPK